MPESTEDEQLEEGFEPLDPTGDDLVPATSSGPEASSPPPPDPATWEEAGAVPPHQEEPQPVSDENQAEDLPSFPEEYRQLFEGLLYLGKLTDHFVWMGHTFDIRTLTVGEQLEIGLITSRYVGTLAEAKAYQAATVAACIERVDNKTPPLPITNEPTDTQLQARFDYVIRSWFPPTINAIFERFVVLDDLAEKVARAAGNSSG